MPIVNGIEAFSHAMAAHANSYVLIGGGACSILFNEAGGDFRLTKDLDIVVLADHDDPGFARDLWRFVKDGGYESGSRKEGGCTYYRFQLPKSSPRILELPGQIELFARHPDFTLSDESSAIAPLAV